MATFHENLTTSFNRFRDKYLKANGNYFFFAYDSTTQKYGFKIGNTFYPFKMVQASKTVTAGTSAKTVTPDSGYDGIASVTVNATPSQSKTATPSTSSQTISPDSGKLLSSVTVNAISTETKTQTAGTSDIDVTPSSGKFLTKVTVKPTPSQEKTITASRSDQTVSPDSGKLLSKVTVNKYPDASGTYPTTATENGTVDLGATHNYRYVSVSVPKWVKIGTGINTATTIDVSEYSGYESATYICVLSAPLYANGYMSQGRSISVRMLQASTNLSGSHLAVTPCSLVHNISGSMQTFYAATDVYLLYS